MSLQDGAEHRNVYLTAAYLSMEEHGIWTSNKTLFGLQVVQMQHFALALI